MAGKRKCYYMPEELEKWVSEMAELNGRPESFIVQLAVKKLREIIEEPVYDH